MIEDQTWERGDATVDRVFEIDSAGSRTTGDVALIEELDAANAAVARAQRKLLELVARATEHDEIWLADGALTPGELSLDKDRRAHSVRRSDDRTLGRALGARGLGRDGAPPGRSGRAS